MAETVVSLAFPQYAALVQGGLALIGVIDDLQKQGATLTDEQRQQIEDTRAQLNDAWTTALAAQNAKG